jgi:hypothetical protein
MAYLNITPKPGEVWCHEPFILPLLKLWWTIIHVLNIKLYSTLKHWAQRKCGGSVVLRCGVSLISRSGGSEWFEEVVPQLFEYVVAQCIEVVLAHCFKDVVSQ